MAHSPSHILELTRGLFRQEAEDLLAELDSALLALEVTPTDTPSLHRAFRALHTLKGSGATAGFHDVAAVLHEVEDIFNDAREGRVRISSPTIDLVLKIADLVRQMTIAPNRSEPALLDRGRKAVEELKSLVGVKPKDTVHGILPNAPEEAADVKSMSGLWAIHFAPEPGIFNTGTDPVMLLRELLSLGPGVVRANTEKLLQEGEIDPEKCYLSWDIQLATSEPYKTIKELFVFVEGESEVRIETVAPESAWVLPAAAYFDASVVQDFRDEAEEDIGEIETQALGVEECPEDSARLDGLKRSIHNLKGLCGLLLSEVRRPPPARYPIRAMRDVCHLAETFLESFAGRPGASLQASASDTLLVTADCLRSLLRAFDEAQDLYPGELFEKLRAFAGGTQVSAAPELCAVGLTSGQATTREASSPSAATQAIGRTVSLRPPRPSAQAAPPPPRPSVASPAQQRTVRVDQGKLDRLMRAVGELLVAKNSLPVLAQRASASDRQALGKDIKEIGDRIAHIADDLQDATRQIRMMPIRSVFQRFPRMIRDLARAQNKQVQLILSGEEIELDKTVLEQIGDPLVHLVRNAVDHGIEPPDERVSKGKPEMGTVGLEVTKEGSHVVLRVSDDGRGMNPERLRAKATEKGLLSETKASELSDEMALQLIFLPGLSTADKITDISGRGVGMDVVQSNVRQLHGTIAIASELGKGSVISIRLPSSLMVSKGILVECAGEQYILPIEGIRQMVKVQLSQIRQFSDTSMATIRGVIYPVFWLSDLLGLERVDASHPGDCGELNAAIVSTQHGDMAVLVDRFVSETDVIVKPLADGLDKLVAFQGATILGDGSVALILDAGQLDARGGPLIPDPASVCSAVG